MNSRIDELTAQGWPHPEMMYAVEWALVPDRFAHYPGSLCEVCHYSDSHDPKCPIPALGYRVLKDAHWYSREWKMLLRGAMPSEGARKICWLILNHESGVQVHGGAFAGTTCIRTRGHHGGIHEPQEGELL